MLASPVEDITNGDFSTSVNHLITMPRHINEPFVSFLLRSIFKFPLIFTAVQNSVASLSHNAEMEGFIEAYGDDEAQALIFVAFLYAMGQDIRSQHSVEAIDRLPHDLALRETIGVLHLAELFDLDSLRHVSGITLRENFLRPISPCDFEWAFGRGSRITGPLIYSSDVPLKIALVDHFTHLWDNDMQLADESKLLSLGKENIEFYLLVKSFCLGHVNDQEINDM